MHPAAAERVVPVLRPLGTPGIDVRSLDLAALRHPRLRDVATPVLDSGAAGLPLGYLLAGDGFDVLVNPGHLLEWAIEPADLRTRALANLAAWSARAGWVDERSGSRHVLSSATGEGSDATRIMLPEVRDHLATALRTDSRDRILVGIPERDLLVAGSSAPDDHGFVDLLAGFVAAQSEAADEPIDRRLFELVDGELEAFGG